MNITSTSNSVTTEKHFGFWGRLSLARKLQLAFGVLIIQLIVIGVITLFGLNRTAAAYQDTLARGVQIRTLSDQLNSAELQARRAEKNFLLRWQSEGFDTAYENYITLQPKDTSSTRGPTYLQNVAAMRELVKQLAPFGPVAGTVSTGDYTQAQYDADIATLTQNIDIYDNSFAAIVSAMQQKGYNESTGLELEMRNRAHSIETNVSGVAGLEQLEITYLSIRRNEKDYITRRDQLYIDNVHTLVSTLKAQTAATDLLTPEVKTDLRTQADNYLTAFDALVATDKKIEIDNTNMVNAARAVEASVTKNTALGDQLAKDGINTAQADSAQTFTIFIVIGSIILLFAIFLATFMSRQITQPVIELTKVAQEISSGNFDTQAEVSSSDEVGTLAKTFNIMTARLGQAFADVNRRAAELATVAEVGTATATILETDRLLQEVVDLTKERFNLYHSHIYLLDDAGENLVLASGAGEAGAQMKAKGLSIPLKREQSLVARAARERKGVTVNDVTQAPDFLPNPLLPDTRSELAVPMIVGGKVIGVFDVQSDQIGRFTESDINIQTTLAAQVSTSIQNVRSFEQSKAQADLESMVNAIGQKIQLATSVDDTLQTAVREIGLALGASRVSANIQANRQGGSNN
jgi:putative methionine-R-sulfoxide reductase with GAF domain